MNKRALLVGIKDYDYAPPLHCSVEDARAMAAVLDRHADGALNYECQLLTSDQTRITESVLRAKVRELFAGAAGGDVLFYFSGHGVVSDAGGHLVTQDGQPDDQGFPMSELLAAANRSDISSVLLILDCCNSGSIGTGAYGQHQDQVLLSEGVTILAASTAQQESREGLEHSIFTELAIDALQGGAADIRGDVSAASLYGYVEQSLGAWQQRPMYQSNARHLNPVRRCEPAVQDALLRELTSIFATPQTAIALDPGFEHTDPSADPSKVALFDKLKVLRNARLLQTTEDQDLYYAALERGSVRLTPLGRYYWQLVSRRRI